MRKGKELVGPGWLIDHPIFWVSDHRLHTTRPSTGGCHLGVFFSYPTGTSPLGTAGKEKKEIKIDGERRRRRRRSRQAAYAGSQSRGPGNSIPGRKDRMGSCVLAIFLYWDSGLRRFSGCCFFFLPYFLVSFLLSPAWRPHGSTPRTCLTTCPFTP